MEKKSSEGQPDPKIEKFEVNVVVFEMVYVPGGTFTMGATAEQGSEADCDEKPTHSVTLSGYYIGKYEVTQAQWKAIMGNNPSFFKGDNLPVDNVSWDDCQEFIRKLNQLTGKKFSLPTEAQWEYAARGGKSGGTKYSGSDTIENVAWYDGNSGYKTHPVGTKLPNDLGIYDMSGNVFEWCEDRYSKYPSYSQTNPTGPNSGSSRVNRGGSWIYYAGGSRVSFRYYFTPDSRLHFLGFRLCCQEPQDEDPVTGVSNKTENEVIFSFNIEKFEANRVAFEMVKVPGGTFTMGATEEQGAYAEDDERPAHTVTLSGYYIGKYEVTQAQWKAIMGTNPSRFQGDNLPVECVSWDDCQEFIRKLNQLTGKKFSLPTEAQWEYAARGGKSGGTKYSGSDNIDAVAWYRDNADRKTHPVGTKSPNSLGIYDMSGNVEEWCSDWYGDYSSYSQTNPTGPNSGSDRVCRGGGWSYSARSCRVSSRDDGTPDCRYDGLGFRLCLEER